MRHCTPENLEKTPPDQIRRGQAMCRLIIPLSRERRLLQRSIDRRELGIEVRTDTIHHRDDRKRDTRRDQAVFNRGRTGLIGQEFPENSLQNFLLLGGL